MKLISMTTRNFMCLPDRDWAFDSRFQVVFGPNEAGKSSLLEAILVCLYADATSKDLKYARAMRWKSRDHIFLALSFFLDGIQCALERDFENQKNLLVLNRKQIKKKEEIREWLAEHLPLPTQEAFLQTACVKQDDLPCNIEASDFRRQIERHSLTATGQDLDYLERKLEKSLVELRKGLKIPAPRSPGPIKQLLDELQTLKKELAKEETQQQAGSKALVEYEARAARVGVMETDVTTREERLRLDVEYLEANKVYRNKSDEIAKLKDKIGRLKALPQLTDEARKKYAALEERLNQAKSKQEAAESWKKTLAEYTNCEAAYQRLSSDLTLLGSCDRAMADLTDPLGATRIKPEDFSRFESLRQERSQSQEGLRREESEVAGLAKELEAAGQQFATHGQHRQQLEETVERLKGEKAKAEQSSKLKQGLRVVSEGQSKVAATIANTEAFNAEKADLQKDLEGYWDLRGIDRNKLQETAASVATLEQVILDEGIQLEVQPEQTLDVIVQTDGGPEEHAVVSDARTVSARTEITVRIPGLARLRLINTSQSARQLANARRALKEMLATTGAKDTESVLDRFSSYDELTKKLNTVEVTLGAWLESRTLDYWQGEADRLGTEAETLSAEIQQLGHGAELSDIETRLKKEESKLSAAVASVTKAEAKIELLPEQLKKAEQRLADHDSRLRTASTEILEILGRAGCENEAELTEMKKSHEHYRAKVANVEAEKAKVLKGRLQEDIVSSQHAEDGKLQVLRQRLEHLNAHALTQNELSALAKGIQALQEEVNTSHDQVVRLENEHQLLGAEQLDAKHQDAVTQAAIADKKGKECQAYAFSKPEERITYKNSLETLRKKLKSEQGRLVELKLRAETAGESQVRIVSFKEKIAEQERQLQRLQQRVVTDGTVLEYLAKAREKAFSDLLHAIPSRVAKVFSRITDDRYSRVEGQGFALQPLSKQKGGALEVEEMSRGTLDQFYLSVRLEALRSTFANDLPPLLLDDAFVTSDAARRSAILAILEEYSNCGQVILFTCHDWAELKKHPCLTVG